MRAKLRVSNVDAQEGYENLSFSAVSKSEGYPEDGWPLWFVAFAFLHNRSFGMLFILGLLIDAILVTTLLAS